MYWDRIRLNLCRQNYKQVTLAWAVGLLNEDERCHMRVMAPEINDKYIVCSTAYSGYKNDAPNAHITWLFVREPTGDRQIALTKRQ